MIGRSLGFFQPIQSRQSERYVHSEQELTAAVIDAASGGARTIVLAALIPISTPIKLTEKHNGLTLRGASPQAGLTPIPNRTLPSLVNIVVSSNDLTSFLIDNLRLVGSGTTALVATALIQTGAGAQLHIRDCYFGGITNDVVVTDGTLCQFQGCRFFGGALRFTRTNLVSMTGCTTAQTIFIDDCLNHQYLGNDLAGLTAQDGSGNTEAIIIVGNNFHGNVDTSAASGAVIVANYMAGNTITENVGTDIKASNHA